MLQQSTTKLNENSKPKQTQNSAPLGHILLIEDDPELSLAITEYLEKNGAKVTTESAGDLAAARITAEQPDVVVLDIMLPGKDGLDICRDLRASGNLTPILFLTARDEDFDQILALELGADDYLTKPVSPRLLLARIKALTRRTQHEIVVNADPDELEFGRLRIHRVNREVMVADRRIDLTPAEFDLLWLLAANAGKVMHRNEILRALRGLHNVAGDRSVDARLYRLRRRFAEENQAGWKIKTVRPHGYMFCNEPW